MVALVGRLLRSSVPAGGLARGRGVPSNLRHSIRSKSTSTVVEPLADVPRTMALPVCFVGVKGWGPENEVSGWKVWSRLFAKAGYGNTLIELDPSDKGPFKNSEELLSALEADLAAELHSTSYPPLLISNHLSTLVAQQYVSSHPLSGLLLHSAVSPLVAHDFAPTVFPTPLSDFTFEPQFPISVMETDGTILKELGGRLVEQFSEDDGGDVKKLAGDRDQEGWNIAMHWMDSNGL